MPMFWARSVVQTTIAGDAAVKPEAGAPKIEVRYFRRTIGQSDI